MSRKRLRQASLDAFLFTKNAKMDLRNNTNDDDILVESASCSVLLEKISSKTPTPPVRNKDEASIESSDSSCDIQESSSACEPKPAKMEKSVSLGPDLSSFQRFRPVTSKLPKLKATENFTVLIRTDADFLGQSPPLPFPDKFVDKWHQDFVRLPCSAHSLYPVGAGDEEKLADRWELIQNALCTKFESSIDVEEAILKYNSRYSTSWSFRAFHKLFTQELSKEQSENYLNDVLSNMVQLALRLPEICTQPIPLLKQGENRTIVMSQLQVGCLLANAFFCTFPRRNVEIGRKGRKSEFFYYPRINFSSIFGGGRVNIEKLKCIFHYFKRITEQPPVGNVSFQRQCLKDFPDWRKSLAHLTQLHVSKKGTIEDFGDGMLQVDFANKYVGGGVLSEGCVQEEIRFSICPELMVSMLFTEVLASNECLIMTGCERYSCYMGYANTFEWSAPFNDETPRDTWGRRDVEIVAIDAKPYHRKLYQQYSEDDVLRELNKAYCGFVRIGEDPQYLSALATGNWGCGAFGGDKEIKSLIQLMAAAESGRDVVYFTFDDDKFMNCLFEVYSILKSRSVTVGELFELICKYNESEIEANVGKEESALSLFDFIRRPPRSNIHE